MGKKVTKEDEDFRQFRMENFGKLVMSVFVSNLG